MRIISWEASSLGLSFIQNGTVIICGIVLKMTRKEVFRDAFRNFRSERLVRRRKVLQKDGNVTGLLEIHLLFDGSVLILEKFP